MNEQKAVRIYVNQVGYTTQGPQCALVEHVSPLQQFQLFHLDSQQFVFSGTLQNVEPCEDWPRKPYLSRADFSAWKEPGEYVLHIEGQTSLPFTLAPAVLFKKTAPLLFSYFKRSRADHPDIWAADQHVRFWGGRPGKRDVRGGWYDASGDISKYFSHLSFAHYFNPQQIPLTAYALAWVREEAAELLQSEELLLPCEKEALWGADYLVRVQDPEGYFYTNIFDGWTGKLSQREICSFRHSQGKRDAHYQAAFREGAGMAIAALARISRWAQSGSFSSAHYLQTAESAFAHLSVHNSHYCSDRKENLLDEITALLAATELYQTTQKKEYLSAARMRAQKLIARLHPTGYFIADEGQRPFFHASDAGLPVLALLQYSQVELDAAQREGALRACETHLNYLVQVSRTVSNPYGLARQHILYRGEIRESFFMPQENETGYWYQGENARLASLATVAFLGMRVLQEHQIPVSQELQEYAQNQLNWILGANPYNICFLAGAGKRNPPAYSGHKKPYHDTLAGGISNGVTSLRPDGSGIQWQPNTPRSTQAAWQNWRWVEQWLPHSTWFLFAVVGAALHESALHEKSGEHK